MRRGFAHTYGNGDCNSYSYGHSNSYRDSDRYGYSNSNRDRDANGYQRAEVDTDAEAASDTTASSLVRNAIWNLLRWKLARKLASPLTGRLKSSLQQTSFRRIDFARSAFGVRCVFGSLSRNESIKMGKKV